MASDYFQIKCTGTGAHLGAGCTNGTVLYCIVLYWVSPWGRVYHWYSRPEQSEPPLVEQVALTASRELGLMKSLPPSPTRHSSWSAHSGENSCRNIVISEEFLLLPISMMGGTAAITWTVMDTLTFLVSFLKYCVLQSTKEPMNITHNYEHVNIVWVVWHYVVQVCCTMGSPEFQ